MSFKNFSQLNEFIASTTDVTDKLNSLVSMCQQGLSQLSAIKQISDAYARQYSLVQQIQYDADGNIQDVTSADRLSVPNTVIDNAKDTISRCSKAIARIKPVDFGDAQNNLLIKPIAKIYSYEGIKTDAAIEPSNVVTINDYYYTSGNSLFLSEQFVQQLTAIVIHPGFMLNNGGSIDSRHSLVVKLPYSMAGVPGNHQIAIIASNLPSQLYVRHTGDFTAFSKIGDILGKDLFNPASYNIPYSDIGATIKWAEWTNYSNQFSVQNALYSFAGDMLSLYYTMADNAFTANSIDCYYSIQSDTTTDIWAILASVADNGNNIMQILNTL